MNGIGWLSDLRALPRERFARWLQRRIPPARSITLNQRRIFIFPGRVGAFFGLCLLAMLVAAINFQNNLSYGLTFLLATLFVVATLRTYGNLAGLSIHGVHADPAFPGQQTEIELLLERTGRREHVEISLHWPGSSRCRASLIAQDSVRVHLHLPVGRQRGWYRPGRLVVETWYPLGLLRAWSLVDLDLPVLVYPRPLPSPAPPERGSQDPEGSSLPVEGSDDFYGFRDYREGDPLRQVYWKGLARGQALQVTQYAAHADRTAWLDWDMFPGAGAEQRLSYLCYWVLQLDQAGEDYGLRLPGVSIAPGRGEQHRERALRALAVYGLGEPG